MTNYPRAFYYLLALLRHSTWSKKQLQEFQNRKLREIVTYAYENSAFYHRRFDYNGLKPNEIKTVEDLRKLPVVRKQEISRNVDEVISREFSAQDLRVQHTSGSTGRPLNIYITATENEFRKAKHVRAQMVLGQKIRDRWVTITSPLHFAETTKLQKALHMFSITPVSVFDDVETQITKIAAANPQVLDGYSNSILLLAKEAKKRGMHDINPRFLVSGAELIDASSRKFVEDVFASPFYDQYATVEFERIAWQCKEKDEYHIDADSLVMEFVDDDGESVSPGERGEVVCTSLFNHAMPFIRYGIDDVGVPSEKRECACGRNFPIMKMMEGRKTSLLTLPGGRVLAPFAFMLAVWTFKHYDLIDLFRVVQKRKDLIVFVLRLKENASNEDLIKNDLERHIREVLHLTEEVSIEVESVDEIPLSRSGKFQIVVSQVEN